MPRDFFSTLATQTRSYLVTGESLYTATCQIAGVNDVGWLPMAVDPVETVAPPDPDKTDQPVTIKPVPLRHKRRIE